MTRHSETFFLTFSLDKASSTPLFRQLYQEIREAILAGRLGPESKLPPSRALAKELQISRNTVIMAFEQLLAEGYVEGRLGAGTYVSRSLPKPLTEKESDGLDETAKKPILHTPRVRDHFMVLLESREQIRPFQPGLPALDEFPRDRWAKLVEKQYRKGASTLLGYGRTAGYRPLCQAIAHYVQTVRGVQCQEEQILITAGSQQGLALLAKVLLQPGDAVWFENPGYIGARSAFQSARAQLISVPVDDQGLCVDQGEALYPQARLAFVTPSHQYPLGSTMSLQRRLSLLDWAKRYKAWVVEDDYDSYFRYTGRPLASLQGLDTEGRVVYMGTFSKVLFPALRLGYLVLPPALLDAFITEKALQDQHSPIIEQAALAEFIENGQFARHLRRMRTLYGGRRDALHQAVSAYLGDRMAIPHCESGLDLPGMLGPGWDDVSLSKQALEAGIVSRPLSSFYLSPESKKGLLLGFSAFSKPVLDEAVQRLARVMDKLAPEL